MFASHSSNSVTRVAGCVHRLEPKVEKTIGFSIAGEAMDQALGPKWGAMDARERGKESMMTVREGMW